MKIIKFNKNFYNLFKTKIEKRNSLSSKSIQEDVKKIIYDVKKMVINLYLSMQQNLIKSKLVNKILV